MDEHHNIDPVQLLEVELELANKECEKLRADAAAAKAEIERLRKKLLEVSKELADAPTRGEYIDMLQSALATPAEATSLFAVQTDASDARSASSSSGTPRLAPSNS